ncbi:MAG: hypothetical protein J1E98_13385 [Lachnospiraceae bacterium]|nr:hypothetical protein [Lachnospiraceae bacterium]
MTDYYGATEPPARCGVSCLSGYLKMMMNTGYVVSEGNTNNAVYKRNTENLAPLAQDLKK